jgi:hypothetical protein
MPISHIRIHETGNFWYDNTLSSYQKYISMLEFLILRVHISIPKFLLQIWILEILYICKSNSGYLKVIYQIAFQITDVPILEQFSAWSCPRRIITTHTLDQQETNFWQKVLHLHVRPMMRFLLFIIMLLPWENAASIRFYFLLHSNWVKWMHLRSDQHHCSCY